MKVNLSGLLKQAAQAIDPDKDHGGYAWMLGEEIPRLLAEVKAGTHSPDEFAEAFCFAPARLPDAALAAIEGRG